jgi:hypothetical protein
MSNLKIILDVPLRIPSMSIENQRKFPTSKIFIMKQISKLLGRAMNVLSALRFPFENGNF